MLKDKKIAIIGLGYVGFPLAIEFANKYYTVGYDINEKRIEELYLGIDSTKEISTEKLKKSNLIFTTDYQKIKDCDIYIVSVPTPIDVYNKPNLSPLLSATKMIGEILKKGDIVIYESTVYPGCTEEECVPLLEKKSNLEYNKDFFCGYSPERINPGDKEHSLTNIKKITSASSPKVEKLIDDLYKSIIKAGTHLAPSIRVAEAAKVIENSQRDINIAFVNELAKIFKKLDIDTNDVLEAAGTKWNFMPFKPGLVGGHCIGVDPFYLAQKAQEVGYNPEIILSGRRMNDSIGTFIALNMIKLLINKQIDLNNATILLLGITFKENCPDIRNTKVIDIYKELKAYNMKIHIYDPWANSNEVKEQFNIELINKIDDMKFDGIILTVSHDEFQKLDIQSLKKDISIVYDIKGVLDRSIVDLRL